MVEQTPVALSTTVRGPLFASPMPLHLGLFYNPDKSAKCGESKLKCVRLSAIDSVDVSKEFVVCNHPIYGVSSKLVTLSRYLTICWRVGLSRWVVPKATLPITHHQSRCASRIFRVRTEFQRYQAHIILKPLLSAKMAQGSHNLVRAQFKDTCGKDCSRSVLAKTPKSMATYLPASHANLGISWKHFLPNMPIRPHVLTIAS
ncbi:hypothetical protein BKA67DRAFT_43472 [Truncatella angustata]|uniref:Uncharacterized protein n=1 Tax=Truncatella angustata TaxID=152316 RepID=A0A9P9A3I7_9PEZI|nr:uncharacterized protein BKA67DRAFT_43472 [Truncatella angustata]KAH6660198.1 hypothetical protein BKA67DRAFT_43472 [Truncatella angustata]